MNIFNCKEINSFFLSAVDQDWDDFLMEFEDEPKPQHSVHCTPTPGNKIQQKAIRNCYRYIIWSLICFILMNMNNFLGFAACRSKELHDFLPLKSENVSFRDSFGLLITSFGKKCSLNSKLVAAER